MKKPWNRINVPVYSISSQAGREDNMHICTYVTAVSMKPKRYMVAIYHGTKTLELVQKNPHIVLQLLSQKQYGLVNQLGKQSGHQVNKIMRLQKRKLLTEWNGFKILQDAVAVMELELTGSMDAGDHYLFVGDLVAYKNLHPGDSLTLDDLRKRKLVRI